MSQPLRALHVIDNLGMGGAETWLVALLRHWRAAGSDAPQIDILATGGREGVYDDEARALGARIFYERFGRATLGRFARRFRSLLRDGGYDALHDHQDYASGWHYLMGGSLLPPVRITHVHNRLGHLRANYLDRPSRRLAARFATGLIARHATYVAGASRQGLEEYGFDRLRGPRGDVPSGPLYCGFDTACFAGDHAEARAAVRREFGWPDEAHIVLCVGRIDASAALDAPLNQKNSAFAAAVGIELAGRDSRVRMLMAGDASPASEILQSRICAAGLGGRIVLAGRRRDVARLMMASDGLLFPSRTEGLGMVVVEAQAAGLPVLASTAVPPECAVAPGLVRFMEVAAGTTAWTDALAELVDAPRDAGEANRRVAGSPFAIEQSAGAVERLCRTGAP